MYLSLNSTEETFSNAVLKWKFPYESARDRQRYTS
jgi:hypothetical protein